MRTFECLPDGSTHEWMNRLEGKSLDEIIALLGPPSREYGPSQATVVYEDKPSRAIFYTKSLEFAVDDGGPVKTIVIHVRDNGYFAYDFRGRELVETKL
jgi:hypothetical protein